VLSWGHFVCNVPTNIFNILTPAVFMSPATLSQTRLVKDIFKLIGKSLNLYDFLTHRISYSGADIRHCSPLRGGATKERGDVLIEKSTPGLRWCIFDGYGSLNTDSSPKGSS